MYTYNLRVLDFIQMRIAKRNRVVLLVMKVICHYT